MVLLPLVFKLNKQIDTSIEHSWQVLQNSSNRAVVWSSKISKCSN